MNLSPNRKKILESILYLISAADRGGEILTQYDIVKSIFIADVTHLNKYGRPVTFSNYSAMEFGPVPSEAYDMLKPNYRWDWIGAERAPWRREPVPQLSPKACQYTDAARAPDERALSQTDIDELSAGLATVKRLGFSGVRDWTHSHPAYVAAWRENGPAGSYPMDYSLLIEDDDGELLEDLAHASIYM